MNSILHSKSHGFHPTSRTVENFCFDCCLQLLAQEHSTPTWQAKLILEEFDKVLNENSHLVAQILSLEAKSWINHLITSLLALSLSSYKQLIEKILKGLSGLLSLGPIGQSICPEIWKWLCVNRMRVEPLFVTSVIHLLLQRESSYLPSQWTDLVILVILNNLRHQIEIELTITCMKMLMSLVTLNEMQVRTVITESVKVLERNEKQRLPITELLTTLVDRHKPSSIKWMYDMKGVELSFKKSLISAEDIALKAATCELLSVLLESNLQGEECVYSDIFDMICSSFVTNEYRHLKSTVRCVQRFVSQPMFNNKLVTQHAIESLLTNCHHLVRIRASEILQAVFQSCQHLLNRHTDTSSIISREIATQLLMLSNQMASESPDLIQAVSQALELTVNTMSARLLNARCIELLQKLMVVTCCNLSTLSLQFPPTQQLYQQYFYQILRLCDTSTRYALSSNSSSLMPEQLDNFVKGIYAIIDEHLHAALEQVGQLVTVDLPITSLFFKFLNHITEYKGSITREYLTKYIQAGGIRYCLELKHWDRYENNHQIASHLLKLLNHYYAGGNNSEISETYSLYHIPASLSELVDKLLSKVAVDTLETSVKVLLAIIETDQRGKYDPQIVRGIPRKSQLNLAKVIAHCWKYMYVVDTENHCKSISGTHSINLKQGLPLFLNDCIERWLPESAGMESKLACGDETLLQYVSFLSGAKSKFCSFLLEQCCQKLFHQKETNFAGFLACLTADHQLLEICLSRFLRTPFNLGYMLFLEQLVASIMLNRDSHSYLMFCTVEKHLAEYVLHNLTAPLDSDILVITSHLTTLLQSRRKQHLERYLVILLKKVLKILDPQLSSQTCNIISNLMVTILHDVIICEEYGVAKAVLEDEALKIFVCTFLHSKEENLELSTLSLLSALYQCATHFQYEGDKPYKLPSSSLLNAMNSINTTRKLIYMQLLYLYTKSSIDSTPVFLEFTHAENVADNRCTWQGFTMQQIKVLAFYLQQNMTMSFPAVKHSAALGLTELMRMKTKKLNNAVINVANWNNVLVQMYNHNKHGVFSEVHDIDTVLKKILEDRQKDSSPFISVDGIVVLLCH